ncbi:Flp pilus assembly protein CpaB [Sandarakinorhabdus glacialis]|nr:Flp pilus assembly protein CpaB [Polymorphobacter glacialis]
MRRSSILMLVTAMVLGLFAVFIARFFVGPSGAKTTPETQTVAAVVAAQPFAFGEKITADKLKIVRWPAAGIPAGTFQRIADAVGSDERVAMRSIDTNELVTVNGVSGKESRMSASQLLGPTMRAASIPITESSAAGGFVAPGDRVDVYVTRDPGDEQYPYSDLIVQNVRVLAVGQDSNVAKDKPEIVKTATIEVSPLQAQKLALAATVGTLSLSLRNILDESQVRLETAQLLDLNDGTVTRILSKPKRSADAPQQVAAAAPAGGPRPTDGRPTGPSVEVFHGNKPSYHSIPSGS